MGKYKTNRNLAAFYLILMCVQYIPIEGMTVSYVKFGAMCLSPIILIVYSPKITKAWLWLGLYCLTVVFSALFYPETFRVSTIGYLLAFAITFLMFYNLIYCEKAFSLDFFIRLLKGLILAYTICLLLQQIAIFFGVKRLPVINLMYSLNRTIWGNSLAIEPSHAARVLTVAFLGLLRMYEVKWGKDVVSIARVYKELKWVLLGFLWSMLTMGSGTAFIGLGILSLYFIKKQYALSIVPLLVILYFVIPYINYEPLQRAKRIADATLSFDQQLIRKTDDSAAARILPLLNTVKELDFSDKNTWFGGGVDKNKSFKYLSKEQTVGGIKDYGLISYVISLIFVFTCCIRKILSLEALIFILLLGAGISNVAYIWGILMIFTTSRYFMEKKDLYHAK